ncbi:hypothetical protein KNO15_05940 [Leifsonia shinshuensis]|uniref:hypothetical protein n=1 Tax=Leifsonia shinshuensis TaxID=150026 RepID=UPI001F50C001|nr:hypothetical protein [Leifsonia shinshuensis]MCI0156236.1 hypothetical protein [Leifsonia shinshuensis]
MLIAALVVSGCTSLGSEKDVPEPTTAFTRLQFALAHELAELRDDAGLVASPAKGAEVPIDFYGSALIREAAREVQVDVPTLDLDQVTSDSIAAYREWTSIPAPWLAYALTMIGVRGSRIPTEAHEVSGTPDERATGHWLATYETAPRSSSDRAETASALRRLVDDPGLGPVGASRVLLACERMSVTCKRTQPMTVELGLDSVDRILDTLAASDLVQRGVVVGGWSSDSARLGNDANELIAALGDGHELEVSALARIAYRTNGSTKAFEGYVDRARGRLDPSTRLYRIFAEPLGTVGLTYDAMMSVGAYWPLVIDRRTTLDSVQRIVREERTDAGADADRLRALAIIARIRALNAAERKLLDAMETEFVAHPGEPAGLSRSLVILDALTELDSPPTGLRLDPVPITERTEGQAADLIAAARDGRISNSADVLEFYSGYIADLPGSLLATKADDPRFLTRLALAASSPDILSGEQWDSLRERLTARTGCESTPHMIRVSTDAKSSCEVTITRRAMSTGLAFAQ